VTDSYAVMGHPITQSKSPIIHKQFAKQTNQDITYRAIEAPIDGFDAAVDAFRAGGGQGLNVTAPFKLDAFRYATVLRDRARQAGAVNCIRFHRGEVEADNFDGIALLRDLETNIGFALRGRRVLLLGAGGAVRGALLPFLGASPADLVVANRTVSKAQALADAFGLRLETADYDELAQCGAFDLIVNGTSASLHGVLPGVPASVFAAGSLAYDMTYGRGLTPFLRLAGQAGVTRLHDGVGMLVEQAAEAFAWWRAIRPDTRRVIERVTVPLV